MGQAQPLQSEQSCQIDQLSGMRRLLADLESGKTAIVTGGADATPAFVLVLKAQIEHLETQQMGPNSLQAPESTAALIACPKCKREMVLFGIERESEQRDLYTFECEDCRQLEVRGVRIK